MLSSINIKIIVKCYLKKTSTCKQQINYKVNEIKKKVYSMLLDFTFKSQHTTILPSPLNKQKKGGINVIKFQGHS